MENTNLTNMKNVNIRTVDPETLADIRDVQVNTSLSKEERAVDFIRQIGNPYCFKHGKYIVKVGFSEENISLETLLADYIRFKS